MGLVEAGRFWDGPTKRGRFVNEVFVFGGPRRLVAVMGRIEKVDDIGLEKPNKHQEKTDVLSELAHKLAQFDMGSLWKTLGDNERRSLFAYMVKQLEV